jgi:hypothetical protein
MPFCAVKTAAMQLTMNLRISTVQQNRPKKELLAFPFSESELFKKIRAALRNGAAIGFYCLTVRLYRFQLQKKNKIK